MIIFDYILIILVTSVNISFHYKWIFQVEIIYYFKFNYPITASNFLQIKGYLYMIIYDFEFIEFIIVGYH